MGYGRFSHSGSQSLYTSYCISVLQACLRPQALNLHIGSCTDLHVEKLAYRPPLGLCCDCPVTWYAHLHYAVWLSLGALQSTVRNWLELGLVYKNALSAPCQTPPTHMFRKCQYVILQCTPTTSSKPSTLPIQCSHLPAYLLWELNCSSSPSVTSCVMSFNPPPP